MDGNFVICKLDKETRLAGSSDCFILQVYTVDRRSKNKTWKNQFYWYSIGDVIRGYINYVAKRQSIKKQGVGALLELLTKVEQALESTCDRLSDAFEEDPIEQALAFSRETGDEKI
jgi:hypothetical protein